MKNKYYEQVSLMLQVLPFVVRQECFALKGGTAINFFVRDLPRYSVDIDLTFVPLLAREESLQKIVIATENIARNIESKTA